MSSLKGLPLLHTGARGCGDGEFPTSSNEPPEVPLDRRELLLLMGGAAALSGMGVACEPPEEKIVPYVRRPVRVTPGLPLYYATSFVLDGFATGLIATTHEGRPTKLEGNPEHPSSLGATGVFEQASILDLYDPTRRDAVEHRGKPSSWERALPHFALDSRGDRPPPWFVLYPQSSPAVGWLLGRIRERHPGARFTFTSPAAPGSAYVATRALFGRPLQTHYRFDRARVILALDADFAASMPMSVRHARDFARARRVTSPQGTMNRLYAVEPMPTPTGSLADHRLAIRAGELAEFAATLLGEVLAVSGAPSDFPRELAAALPRAERSPHAAFVRALARDLAAAHGASLVVPGDHTDPELHVLAHALNAVLDNWDATITLTEPVLLEPEGGAPLAELADALRSRAVGTLAVLDANPVFGSPPELQLGRLLPLAAESIHLTYRTNSTSRGCHWVLPSTHYLEAWGDARGHDGTLSFVQPVIAPLRRAKSTLELLAAFAGVVDPRGHDLLREFWSTQLRGEFKNQWSSLIQRGFAPETQFPAVVPRPNWSGAGDWFRRASTPALRRGIELRLLTSPSVYDGRFASNPWLRELPHPITKQTWDNAALLSPRTARTLGVSDGDVLELGVGQRRVRAPALLVLGHAEHSITLELGYGEPGEPAAGTNAYQLSRTDRRTLVEELVVRPTGEVQPLAITQEHQHTHDRPIIAAATLREYRRNPDFTRPLRAPLPTLLRVAPRAGRQWAMTIDTTICTGCSSCVVACQAENNVPVVGKSGVLRSREMHWLRIDRYVLGSTASPRFVNQPMLCQHCENAPCEYVCPVNATVHSPDGLNEMVYNRCIGTRFCSNNCPYKVRRFNWFDYTSGEPSRGLQRNPEVTVRARGVMEKCTFCVQRIRRAEARARVERRPDLAATVVTACQQACPTEAIQFGSLDAPGSKMLEWRKEPRSYAVLHELGARPRTLYLARIDNPNPELDPEA